MKNTTTKGEKMKNLKIQKGFNKELCNFVQKQIIDQSNQNGTILANEFETEREFKNFVISCTIKQVQSVLECGIEIAYNVVMGEGSYKKMCDSCWAN